LIPALERKKVSMSITPDTRVDLDRFWSTIEASGEIGKGRPGGL
jgi:N-carbamoyl-L-amino-acid hydrolase